MPHRRQRFALLTYDFHPGNLGDAIQSIAAQQYLPMVDAWVDRERLDEFRRSDSHKIILNGWFLHRPEHWPPSETLRPLITSFHLTRERHPHYNLKMLEPAATVLSRGGIEYLKQHEPVGARDLDTLGRLEDVGIEAYFSGCLTLTLRRPQARPRTDAVFAVDLSPRLVSRLRRRYASPITELTHLELESNGRRSLDAADRHLDLYTSARAVVTSRLHCALPCLALGTPVLLVEAAADPYRLTGLRELLHRASEEDLIKSDCGFDLENPPANGDDWLPMATRLRTICERFVERER